ncbi:hypothetical protein LshimejAT787_0212620 [Lyophyllum shimeji]|uniref:Uncharacterized protein n=1 Tax=Lyophyllum shimeji TaxID=47721 RepID=A0A9P3UJR5_LYOSH|nr:hypothetical protein LshimejAT787_0212620 [Lyophyllum shimeji]
MSRLFLLPSCLLLFIWISTLVSAAPATCSFSCPSADENGYGLITSPYATSYDGPYSIFDCVYAKPGATTPPHTCSYYKSNGLHALGTRTSSACPKQAATCSEDHPPQFSAPEKVETPPWIGPGNDLLYWKEHHPGSPTPS